MSNKTCGALAGSRPHPCGGTLYITCGKAATHVEVEGDMQVYLCERHAAMHKPSTDVVLSRLG